MFVRRLALAIAVLFGLIGAQGPEFAQQYRQRIGGALDELKAIIGTFDAEASHEGLAPAAAIARLEQNPDPLARERGRAMDEAVIRAGRLERQLEAMSEAGPIRRLAVFVTNFDPPLAKQTLQNYEPAAPLTFEALAAGGLAAVWGWAATHICCWPFRRRRSAAVRGAA
jgi:Protein of unknown function (DUF2937)